MANIYLCSKCGNRIITGVRKYQGKLYCEHCYEQIMEEAQRFEEEKQKLILFIKDLFSIPECPDVVLYAIDRAIKDDKKLSGIKGTLIYYYNIKGNPADNVGVIGNVIQHEYANAAKYYEETKRIRATNEQIDINVPAVTVKVHSSKGKKYKSKYRMEDL